MSASSSNVTFEMKAIKRKLESAADPTADNSSSLRPKKKKKNKSDLTILDSSESVPNHSAPHLEHAEEQEDHDKSSSNAKANKKEKKRAKAEAKRLRKQLEAPQVSASATQENAPSKVTTSLNVSKETSGEARSNVNKPKEKKKKGIEVDNVPEKFRSFPNDTSLFALPGSADVDSLGELSNDDLRRVIQSIAPLRKSSPTPRTKSRSLDKTAPSVSTLGTNMTSKTSKEAILGKGVLSAMLSTKWLTSKELAELAETEGLEYKKGRFSSSEKQSIQTSIDTYKTQNGLTEDDISGIIFRKERTAGDNEFWTFLAREIGGRPLASIYHYVHRAYNPLKQQGQWTADEDQALKAAVAAHGERWKIVGPHVGRTGSDCRDRYRNYVKHGHIQNNGLWSKEEEDKLIDIVESMKAVTGSTAQDDYYWTTIAEKMGHIRNRQQCRTKWQDSIAPRLSNQTSKAKWSDCDTMTMLSKLAQLDISEESDVQWASLTWGGWSGHRLQKSWKRLKRKANLDSVPFKDALSGLIKMESEAGRKSPQKFISREFIDSDNEI
ncbi:RNA polymerase I enhancer binding protein [Tulasnella sp. 418]|nr:RNA polymerase I enhancer binding protein [Tulasnella sp. 418]